MKRCSLNCARAFCWFCSLACLIGVETNLKAAPPKPMSPAAETNAPPADESLPKSEFDEKGGKDPFFPMRVITPVDKPKDGASVGEGVMVLNGFSGTVTRPLAIINGRTFEVGEVAEVPTTAGKLKIRCVEIHPPVSVTMEIFDTGVKKELRKGL